MHYLFSIKNLGTLVVASVFVLGLFAFAPSLDAGNIDTTYYRAKILQDGSYINFGKYTNISDATYGATVSSSGVTGYAWSENYGWISLDCSNGSNCASNGNFKVTNDGTGNLSGYAWGENTGYIYFGDGSAPDFANTATAGVEIDANGHFSGYAWGENVGWISFNCTNGAANDVACSGSDGITDYRVQTTWVTGQGSNPNPSCQLFANGSPGDLNIMQGETVDLSWLLTNIGGNTMTLEANGQIIGTYDQNDLILVAPTATTMYRGSFPSARVTSNTCTLTVTVNTFLGQDTIQFKESSYTVGEDEGGVEVLLERVGTGTGSVSVTVLLQDGASVDPGSNAEGDVDYDTTGAPFTVSWADGDTADKTITIPILDDTIHEPVQYFQAVIGAPFSGDLLIGSQKKTSVFINDDDVPANVAIVQFTTNTRSINENVPTGVVSLTLNRTGNTTGTTQVTLYTLETGTALRNNDFVPLIAEQVTFAPSESSKDITVSIINDSLKEGSVPEDFSVVISGVSGGSIGTVSNAHVSIIDDDGDIIPTPQPPLPPLPPFVPDVYGCTDPGALNFDSTANIGDGSCTYPVETETETELPLPPGQPEPPVPPQTPQTRTKTKATITIVKELLPNTRGETGTASPHDFNVVVRSGFQGPVSLRDGRTKTLIPASGYQLFEDTLPHYTFVEISGAGCPQRFGDFFTLVPDQDLICTITNRYNRDDVSLRVTKRIIPFSTDLAAFVSGPVQNVDDFELHITSQVASSSPLYVASDETLNGLSPSSVAGQYMIHETDVPDYVFSEITGDVGCPSTLGETFSLEKGDHLHCVVWNRYLPATETPLLPESPRKPIDTNLRTLILQALALIGLAGGILNTIPGLALRIQNAIFGVPGFRRRHRPWGTVYDSVTKQPIDPAYVTLYDEAGNQTSMITDLDGRYGFLVTPQKYRIVAGKTNYVFPSERLRGQSTDEPYRDLYFGEDFVIHPGDDVVMRDIPMDPVDFNFNEYAKKEKRMIRFYSRGDIITRRVFGVLFIAGFVFSVIALILKQDFLNIAVAVLYGGIALYNIFSVQPSSFGSVTDKAGNPLAGAIVRVYSGDKNVEHEIAKRIADDYGRYHLLVVPGKYYITVEIKNADGSYRHAYTSPVMRVRNGVINKDLRV